MLNDVSESIISLLYHTQFTAQVVDVILFDVPVILQNAKVIMLKAFYIVYFTDQKDRLSVRSTCLFPRANCKINNQGDVPLTRTSNCNSTHDKYVLILQRDFDDQSEQTQIRRKK